MRNTLKPRFFCEACESTGGGWKSKAQQAIEAALEKKLEDLAEERRLRLEREKAEDEAFTKAFLKAAMDAFKLMDEDKSMSLDKQEIVDAVTKNQKVIDFLRDCGNRFLQELHEPSRLEYALDKLDTDRDGTISIEEWETAIEEALQIRLSQMAAERRRKAKAAQKEKDKFATQFLLMARQVFVLMDVDDGGTLSKQEIVDGVTSNEEVTKFLAGCGNEDLMMLLKPRRLEKAGPPVWMTHFTLRGRSNLRAERRRQLATPDPRTRVCSDE